MADDYDYEPLPDVHPHVLANDQVREAIRDLNRPEGACVRWPWAELDAMSGPMNTGEVWFLCAISSGGKTTFVASAIELWRALGKKIYVMPLESQAKRFRTYLACMAVGEHPGDALSGNLPSLPGGDARRAHIIASLGTQFHQPYVDQVMVSSTRSIDVAGLKQGLKEAKAFGADIVIVDHIDHIDGGDGSNLFSDSKAVNHAALRMAQDNDMTLLFTSQLNLNVSRNPDHLGKYAPPRVHDVFLPSIKLHIATGMLGLFRKVRERHEHETPDEYLELLKRAKKGEVGAPDVLDKHVMGVNAMKLRNYGSREGSRAYLGFEKGRVIALDEKDRFTTSGGRPRSVV